MDNQRQSARPRCVLFKLEISRHVYVNSPRNTESPVEELRKRASRNTLSPDLMNVP